MKFQIKNKCLRAVGTLTKRKCIHFVGATIVLVALFSFSSCELESSKNGDLDGFWHLESIDSLENGQTIDLSKLHIFWGIEHKLIAVRESDYGKSSFYFRFEQTSDSLKITEVFLNHGHQDNGEDGGDIPQDEVTDDLRYYGVNAIPDGFVKEALNGSKMILKSKTVRLNFKKF